MLVPYVVSQDLSYGNLRCGGFASATKDGRSSHATCQPPILVQSISHLYWCNPLATYAGATRQPPMLVHTVSHLFWCNTLVTYAGAICQPPMLVQTVSHLFWYNTLITCFGTICQPPMLLQSVSHLYWCKRSSPKLVLIELRQSTCKLYVQGSQSPMLVRCVHHLCWCSLFAISPSE